MLEQGNKPALDAVNWDKIPPEQGDESCFMDRELSWLQFNRRILEEAGDLSVPLLERLKFLDIYQTNLNEFFMVRVGTLTHRAALLPGETDPKTGWTAARQLSEIWAEVALQQGMLEKVWRRLLLDFSDAAIDVVDFRKLTKGEESLARSVFAELRPMLSPRIVDGGHPFPFLGNREPWVVCLLERKGQETALGLVSLYRLPVCRVLEQDGRRKVFLTGALLCHFAPQIFRKLEVREAAVMQVVRNADVFFENDILSYNADVRAGMEKMLRKRKRQQPVRLQLWGKTSRRLAGMLLRELHMDEESATISPVPPDLSFSEQLAGEGWMHFPQRRPVRTVLLKKGEYFAYLERKDLFLAFPFQSMLPFVDLLYEAADDPAVVSIRISLYRLSASSKVAAALAYAAERGKEVLCLLELRARFDEQNNIDYSKMLEDAGCQVIYGLPFHKVHCKLCLITRRTGDEVGYITQIGTGNYNEITSEHYTDFSVITADHTVGRDAAAVFDALALGQIPPGGETLWVAPKGYRERVLALVDGEIARGSAGRITIKVNSLNDLEIMRRLIRASRAGVPVELFVRGICCLRPGIPGCTENITVKSIVGRYLEHSRIFVFGEGERARIFVGSGDLLNRNTQRRVEAFVECCSPESRQPVLEVLEALRKDRAKGWFMQPDGSYIRAGRQPGSGSQDALYAWFGNQRVEPVPPRRKRKAKPAAAVTPPIQQAASVVADAAGSEKKPGWLHRLLFFWRKK